MCVYFMLPRRVFVHMCLYVCAYLCVVSMCVHTSSSSSPHCFMCVYSVLRVQQCSCLCFCACLYLLLLLVKWQQGRSLEGEGGC
jgi:hypothetical protein